MGRAVWEESSLTEGVGDKRELVGDGEPALLRCDADAGAQGVKDVAHR